MSRVKAPPIAATVGTLPRIVRFDDFGFESSFVPPFLCTAYPLITVNPDGRITGEVISRSMIETNPPTRLRERT